MKILVTGGAGFIGSNFVHFFLEVYPNDSIVNLDKLTYAGGIDNLENLKGDSRHKFVKGDISDVKLVNDILDSGIDAVVNFAAETHVDRSIQESRTFVETDVLGTLTLLDVCRRHKIPRYVQISTDEVYGSMSDGYLDENANLNPSSPYSASKASADMLVMSYWTTHHLPVLIIRCTNNFGPYQFPEKIIPLFITNALEDKKVPMYGDGKYIRDWLYVEDCCRAVDIVLRKGKDGEVYNAAGRNEVDNLTLTRKILSLLGKPETLIDFVANRPGHDRRYAINDAKLRDKLSWKPVISFDEGLKHTVNWYEEHGDWWKKRVAS